MARIIIQIDQIIAGRGLESNRQTFPPSIEVRCGPGIEFGDNNEVTVAAGPGLNFNEFNDLVISNEELAGAGLVPGDGSALDIDVEEVIANQQTMRVVTDAGFRMDGYQLTFCVTYTTFIVRRNCRGLVIGIDKGQSDVECRPLNICGYGDGSCTPPVTSKTSPCFYKK